MDPFALRAAFRVAALIVIVGSASGIALISAAE